MNVAPTVLTVVPQGLPPNVGLQEIPLNPENGDARLNIFRKLSKTLKPAVLLKSWQRVCMLVAGIEAMEECGQASIATLEKSVYDRYHGNIHRDPPVVGTVKRAMDDQLEALATEKFGIKFPRDKISYAQMTAGMPGHTIWRYYKELVTEVANKICLIYRSCLREDLSFPDGKSLYDAIEDTLRILWNQNEDVRKERALKRIDGVDGHHHLNDSDSEQDGADSALKMPNDPASRKRPSGAILLNTKLFPGVGRYQPISFLSFLLLGPPAGEKCWQRFSLDAHLESAPPRPRITAVPRTGRLSIGEGEDMNLDDIISPNRKRQKTGKDHIEEENEAIRIFNAETTARAQRLEELKLALSLFPDDENIKAELKQFVDSQRRTSLTAESHQYGGVLPPNMFLA
eukprot:scaffold1435_cov162-Ochromonas_danica.AAC.14